MCILEFITPLFSFFNKLLMPSYYVTLYQTLQHKDKGIVGRVIIKKTIY